jgi:hypothetical protein
MSHIIPDFWRFLPSFGKNHYKQRRTATDSPNRAGSLDFTDEKGPEAFAFGLPMEYFLKIFRGWVDSPLL